MFEYEKTIGCRRDEILDVGVTGLVKTTTMAKHVCSENTPRTLIQILGKKIKRMFPEIETFLD